MTATTTSTSTSVGFEVQPVTGTLGAEIVGLNIADELPGETLAALERAFVEHKVLFFRDQHDLDDARHVAFARRFGPIQSHPLLPHAEGFPEVSLITSPEMKGKMDPAAVHARNWHSDVTFHKTPPLGSILRAVDIPAYGRDTMWCDMEAAYDLLSDTMKELIAPLRAVHDWRRTFRAAAKVLTSKFDAKDTMLGEMGARMDALEDEEVTIHPVVRTHPVSGRKSLFVNSSFTDSIVGMRPDESEMLLEFLCSQTRYPALQVRFRWAPGSVAMWDNRSVQHYIINDHPYAREMRRVTIEGDEPR